jgi:2'-5' RNA ligase
MAGCTDGAERINLFALVVYISDPLAKFLDDLRRELTPGCLPRAHVTILPPRPLAVGVGVATEAARAVVSGFAPFNIVPGGVEIFRTSNVIYLGIKEGERELREIYRALNRGPLAATEPFPYHPHITLAQDLTPGQVQPLYQLARERWAAFPASRRIRAERACFVQSRADAAWLDLAEFRLQGVVVG